MSDWSEKIILIVGTRDTGKTSFAKEMILGPGSLFPRQLVIDELNSTVWRNMKTWNRPELVETKIPRIFPEQLPYWKSGLYRMYGDDTQELLNVTIKNVFNTWVVLEDASRYFSSKLTTSEKRIVLNTKQNACTLTAIFHTIADVPPKLASYADYLVFFKTREKAADTDKFTHPEFTDMFKRVSAHKDKHYFEILKL